jgi:hypothetical protein
MSVQEVMIEGVLQVDGTLQLNEKPNLAPGRVTVVLRRVEEPKSVGENWLQCLEGIRVKREAEGYPFMNEQETSAHVQWLREGDRIDDLLREVEQHPGASEKP